MRRHLERAVAIAAEDRKPAARCEALALLAIEAARLGATAVPPDEPLLELAEASADQVKELLRVLPGRPPWGAYADAALARVRLARGDVAGAAAAGGAVVEYLQGAGREDALLPMVLPAARALLAGAPPDVRAFVGGYLRMLVSRIAQGTVDESVRVRWLRGPLGRELVELAGPMDAPTSARVASAASPSAASEGPQLDDVERRLLQLLTEGNTNREMAADLGLTEDEVTQRLARLLAQLGASSRAEATSLAFRGLVPVGAH
jgi:DNA-binding CsgD family transcriptional regulator